jgi:hypothetical protein
MKKTFKLTDKPKGLKLVSGIIVFSGIFMSLLVLPACSKKNDGNTPTTAKGGTTPDKGISSCKDTPAQLAYVRTKFDLIYNGQGNPVKFTSTKPLSVQQPMESIITAYSIEYDGQGRVSRVSRMINSKTNGYYVPEYNSSGQMIKLGEYDIPGQQNVHYTADFDQSGNVIKITALVDGNANPQTCNYTYAGGNLVKKSIQNFYDPISKEFINADFTYDYYTDKVKKDKIWFTGLLGLRIMADFADSKSMLYITTAERGQLLFAQEGTASKNLLKHIKATAQRYNTTDDTNVDYTYEYDGDGIVKYQKGDSRNVITRSEASPFGGSESVTVPTNFSSAITIEYLCP